MADLIEGSKFDDGKLPLDLWSYNAIESTAEVLGYGAAKYDEWNWAKGIKYRRVFAALLRHLWAWWRGEDNDPEWGCHHLAHAMCCLMFLLHYETNKSMYTNYDDRPVEYYVSKRTNRRTPKSNRQSSAGVRAGTRKRSTSNPAPVGRSRKR